MSKQIFTLDEAIEQLNQPPQPHKIRRTLLTEENDPRHGTPNGYNNHYCRCERCTRAWSEHIKHLRATSPQYQEAVRRANRNYYYRKKKAKAGN